MPLTGGINLASLMVDIKADIKGFKDDMSKAAVAGVGEAKKISKELSNVTKVGENLSKVGGNLTKFVSVPLAGVGIAAGKMAIDFESNFAKVSTLLDSNVVNFDDYKTSLLKASNDSKVAVGEFSDAVYESISAGVDQTKAIGFTTEAMKLAKGGFTTGAKAVDVMTTAINGYKLKTEDANRISDLLIVTQNAGKTTVDELASSMGSVIPIASAANYSIDELSAAYALMTKNGIATSEAGTYVKSMLSELTKAGSITDKALRELSGKGFAELKAEGKDTSEIFSMLNKHAKDNNITLKDMFGSVEAGSAAMVLASGDGAEYNEMLKAMEGSAGATQAAFEKIDISPAEQMKGALNKVKNAGIELGISLVPAITKVADVISGLADKFSNLTDEQQSNILKWGGIAIAAGPVLKLVGGGIQTFASLKSIIGGTSAALGVFEVGAGAAATATAGVTTATATAAGATGLGGLVAGLGGVVVAAAPFVLAGAAVVGAGYAIHKELSEEVVPTVDLFADKVTYSSQVVQDEFGNMAATTGANTVVITEATKDAVGSYMTMDDEVSRIMYGMNINNTAMTTELAESVTGKFQSMADTVKAGQQSNYEAMLADYSQFFADNITLTEQREAEIIANMETDNSIKQGVIDGYQARINEIVQRAADSNVEITAQEEAEINNLQTSMRNAAITELSTTAEEAAVIRERMKDYQGRLTAEMASEMITNANNARDGEIKAAEEKYDETIRQATRMKEAGQITEEEYKAMIESAKTAKTEQIDAANEACEGVKTEIVNATPGIDTEVNIQTGKIKTAYDKLSEGLGSFFSGLAEKMRNAREDAASTKQGLNGNHYNGLSYVPFDGYVARLHKGERVLTAEENKSSVQGNVSSNEMNQTLNFYGKVESPYEVAKATKKSMRDLQFT
ncbi:phage tail tape measure protein [Clostridium sp.]|uniref:phage tail tape measure protein n=1 Tax=Clostridium sp. TaxID=1506 RepID=UPI003216AACA